MKFEISNEKNISDKYYGGMVTWLDWKVIMTSDDFNKASDEELEEAISFLYRKYDNIKFVSSEMLKNLIEKPLKENDTIRDWHKTRSAELEICELLGNKLPSFLLQPLLL